VNLWGSETVLSGLRQGRLRKWIVGVVVLGVAWVAMAGRVLVVHVPMTDPDVIISLSGHDWERLPATATLALLHPKAVVLVSEPGEVTRYNCSDCAHRVDRLVLAGIPPARVQLLPTTNNGTYWEAVGCREFLAANKLHRLVVVTSPYHTLRAFSTFRKVLAGTEIEVGIEPAWEVSPARPSFWWTRFGDIRYVAYEWAAVVSYVPRHGIFPVFAAGRT
jgi:uncharacterized SAM-binding protein YcdF (DUF218 family)